MPIPQLQSRDGSGLQPPKPPARSPRGFHPWRVFFIILAILALGAAAMAGVVGYRVVKAAKKLSGGAVPLRALAALPDHFKDKTVLLLLLNNAELRPGGGFIGSIGLLQIQNASLASFKTHDVYALDQFGIGTVTKVPPAPIAKYLNVKAWYLRDANWSPDFATSSVEVLRAYREEAEHAAGAFPPVDGVMGVTPEFFSDLLRVTGPITVGETTFRPETFADQLEYQVERAFLETGVPREQRKEIIGELGRELLSRIERLPPNRFGEVLGAVERAFRERHLLAYDENPELQQFYERIGWAGRIKDVSGDYLLVADANLASLKSDPAVRRTIAYRIDPAGVANVEITYKHQGRFDWKTTRYRTYTRVYAPLGSAFLDGSGAMENDKLKDPARRPGTFDVSTDQNKSVFGAFISIEPGETRTLTFRYQLPRRILDDASRGSYSLLVQKQLGTVANGLTLDLGFGKRVTSAVPGELPAEHGDERYRLTTDLREDRIFEIRF